MIQLFFGENDFERSAAVKALTQSFSGEVERFDGSSMSREDLANATTGATLFSSQRLVVIDQLSENKDLWAVAVDFLSQAADDSTVVLVEAKLDKRTTTYKWLQKNADTNEFPALTVRDIARITDWCRQYATTLDLTLTTQQAQAIVDRTGLDQWAIHHALQKLALVDEINEATIQLSVDTRPTENVFLLLETAFGGDTAAVQAMADNLKQTDDAYRVLALLASQVQQLAAVVLAKQAKGAANVATDLGVSPFVLRRLTPLADSLSGRQAASLIQKTATADMATKTGTEPWLAVEMLLHSIGRIQKTSS